MIRILSFGLLSILSIHPEFFLIPDDDFITTVAEDVQYFTTEFRMSVVGEGDDDVPIPVHQASVLDTGMNQEQIATGAIPVHRCNKSAVAPHLL